MEKKNEDSQYDRDGSKKKKDPNAQKAIFSSTLEQSIMPEDISIKHS